MTKRLRYNDLNHYDTVVALKSYGHITEGSKYVIYRHTCGNKNRSGLYISAGDVNYDIEEFIDMEGSIAYIDFFEIAEKPF